MLLSRSLLAKYELKSSSLENDSWGTSSSCIVSLWIGFLTDLRGEPSTTMT